MATIEPGEVQSAKPKAVNLALETVIQFDKKHNERDIQLIEGIQSLLSKVKKVIKVGNKNNRRQNEVGKKKFTDYLIATVDTLLSLEDSDLEKTFTILKEECKKFHYEGSRFEELLENEDLKIMFEDFTGKMDKSLADDIRETLDDVKDKLKNKGGKYKELFDFLNTINGDDIVNKFEEFFKNIQVYKESRQESISKLNHVMKDGIRSVFFDHYSKLDETGRRGFSLWLDRFLTEKQNSDRAESASTEGQRLVKKIFKKIREDFFQNQGNKTGSPSSFLRGAFDIIYPYVQMKEKKEHKKNKKETEIEEISRSTEITKEKRYTVSHRGKKQKTQNHENNWEKPWKNLKVKISLPKFTKPINRKLNENNFMKDPSTNNYGKKKEAVVSAAEVIDGQRKGNKLKTVKPAKVTVKAGKKDKKLKLSLAEKKSEEPIDLTSETTESDEESENKKITTQIAAKKNKHSDSDTEESYPMFIPFKENTEKKKSEPPLKVANKGKLPINNNNPLLEKFTKIAPKKRRLYRVDLEDTDDSNEKAEKVVSWTFNSGSSSSSEDEHSTMKSRRDLGETVINSRKNVSTDTETEEGMTIEDLETKIEDPKTNRAVVTNKSNKLTETTSYSKMKTSTSTTVTDKNTESSNKNDQYSPKVKTTPMFRSEISDVANHSAEISAINDGITTVTAKNTFVTSGEKLKNESTVDKDSEIAEESNKTDNDNINEVFDRTTKYKIKNESKETTKTTVTTTAFITEISSRPRVAQDNGEINQKILVPNYYKADVTHKTNETKATEEKVKTIDDIKISNDTRRISHDDPNSNKKEHLKKLGEATITENPDGSKIFPINLRFT